MIVAALLALPAVQETDWRRAATDADRARLRDWRASWTEALDPEERRREPLLFDPDRALAGAAPPAGTYRCRTHRIGSGPTSAPAAVPAWTGCRVEAAEGRLRFVADGGMHRPAGHLFADTDARLVFLGAAAIGDEARALPYGRDRQRDMAGILERVGPDRWRLVLPEGRYGSTLDVIELVPR